jgi:hypothetical protein
MHSINCCYNVWIVIIKVQNYFQFQFLFSISVIISVSIYIQVSKIISIIQFLWTELNNFCFSFYYSSLQTSQACQPSCRFLGWCGWRALPGCNNDTSRHDDFAALQNRLTCRRQPCALYIMLVFLTYQLSKTILRHTAEASFAGATSVTKRTMPVCRLAIPAWPEKCWYAKLSGV